MPLHEQREDFREYQAALVNQGRRTDLKKEKYRKLPNWESLKTVLSLTIAAKDLVMPAVDGVHMFTETGDGNIMALLLFRQTHQGEPAWENLIRSSLVCYGHLIVDAGTLQTHVSLLMSFVASQKIASEGLAHPHFPH